MKLDLFLVNLLYGIIFLTTSLAVSYFLSGILLVGDQDGKHPIRGILRTALVLICLSGATLLFHLQSSGESVFGMSAPAKQAVLGLTPRLVQNGLFQDSSAQRESGNLGEGSDAFQDASWSVSEVRTREVGSSLKQIEGIFAGKPRKAYSLIGKKSPPECRAWAEVLKQRNLQIQEVDAVAPVPHKSVLLACLSAQLRDSEFRALQDYVRSGGALFLVGEPTLKAQEHSLGLLNGGEWKETSLSQASRITVGGPYLAFGGFASGFQFPSGDESTHWLLARKGETQILVDGNSRHSQEPLTNLVFDSLGDGKVVWTSLPANLYGKLWVLRNDSWNLLIGRIMAYLFREPVLGLELWQKGQEHPVILGVRGEFKYANARALLGILSEKKVSAAFYPVLSEALADPKTTDAIRQSGFELNFTDVHHEAMPSGIVFDRLSRENDAFRVFGSEGPRGFLARRDSTASAPLFAQLTHFGFDYAITDPFRESIAPSRIGLFKSGELRELIARGGLPSVDEAQRSLLLIPAPERDDLSLLADAASSEASWPGQIVEEYRSSEWAGGPYVLIVHTQGLGSPERTKTFEKILTDLGEQGAVFVEPRALAQWWTDRSRLSIEVDRRGGANRCVFDVELRNNGSRKVRNALLRITEPDDWTLEEGGKEVSLAYPKSAAKGHGPLRMRRQEVPELDPGEVIKLKIRKSGC